MTIIVYTLCILISYEHMNTVYLSLLTVLHIIREYRRSRRPCSHVSEPHHRAWTIARRDSVRSATQTVFASCTWLLVAPLALALHTAAGAELDTEHDSPSDCGIDDTRMHTDVSQIKLRLAACSNGNMCVTREHMLHRAWASKQPSASLAL